MRVRTPGQRWFDSEGDFSRRCAAPKAGEDQHDPWSASPQGDLVADVRNAARLLQAQLDEHLEVNRRLHLFYPPEPHL